MQYAVCIVPIAAVRSMPDHKAEMTSQLLFGECCTITEFSKNGFVKITVKADGYEGWCQQQHFAGIDLETYNLPPSLLAASRENILLCRDSDMHIPFGSSLTSMKNSKLSFENNVFEYTGKIWDVTEAKRSETAIKEIAAQFLNTPYLWGGRSIFGTDCSGFTQMVYKFLNIALQRDARQQALQGTTVDFLQQAQCGDLAFFDNEDGEIIHVGLLLNNTEIIHASGKVQVDDIDTGGIINRATGMRTQKLRIIKRYF